MKKYFIMPEIPYSCQDLVDTLRTFDRGLDYITNLNEGVVIQTSLTLVQLRLLHCVMSVREH